jgi:hypothetical protein
MRRRRDRQLSKLATAIVIAGLIVTAMQACGGRDQLLPGEEGYIDEGGGAFGPGPGAGGDVGPGPGVGGLGPGSGGFGPGPGAGGAMTTVSTTVGTVTSGTGMTSVSSVGPGAGGSSMVTTVGAGGMGSGGFGGFGPTSSSAGVGGSGGFTTTSVGVGGGNPIDCLTCIAQNCPQAIQCIQNPNCLQGSICTVQNCLVGGTPDLGCALNCFNGDIGAALLALQSLQCMFQTCGQQCGGLLGGPPPPGP